MSHLKAATLTLLVVPEALKCVVLSAQARPAKDLPFNSWKNSSEDSNRLNGRTSFLDTKEKQKCYPLVFTSLQNGQKKNLSSKMKNVRQYSRTGVFIDTSKDKFFVSFFFF